MSLGSIVSLLLFSITVQFATTTPSSTNISIEPMKQPLMVLSSTDKEYLTESSLLQSSLLPSNHQDQYPSYNSQSERKIRVKHHSRHLSEDMSKESNVFNGILQGLSLSSLLLKVFLEPNKLSSLFALSLVSSQNYIPYINASLSESVTEELDTILSPFSITNTLAFKAPEGVQAFFPNMDINSVFEERGLHSSYIVNQWNLIIIFIILFIMWTVTYLLKDVSKRYQSKILNVIVRRLRILMRWNLFLLVILTSYDKLTLFSVLQFGYLAWDSTGSILSFIVCLVFSCIALFIFVKLFTVSILAQKKKIFQGRSHSNNMPLSLEKKLDTFKAIHAEYKDSSLLHRSYLFLASFRTIFSYIAVGSFPTYPIIPALMILTANSSLLYYVATEKPLKNAFASKMTLIFEMCFLLLNLFVTMAVMNSQVFETSASFQVQITYLIMITKLILGICSHLFMVIQTGLTVRTLYTAVKLKSIDAQVTWKNIVTYLDEHLDLLSEVKPDEKKDEPTSAAKPKCPLILIHHPEEETNPTTATPIPTPTIAKMDKTSPKKNGSPTKNQSKFIQFTLDSDFETQDNLLVVTASSQQSLKNTTIQNFGEAVESVNNILGTKQSLWHRRVSRKSAIAGQIASVILEEPSMGSLDSGRNSSARGQPKEERGSVHLLQKEVPSLFGQRNLSRLSIEQAKDKEGGLLSNSIDDATKRPSTKGTQTLESPTPTSFAFGESWYSKVLGDSPKNGGLKSVLDIQGGEINKETMLSRNRSSETMSRRRSFRRQILSRDMQSRELLSENKLKIPIAAENDNSLSFDFSQPSPKINESSYSESGEMDKSESQTKPLKNFRTRWQKPMKQNI